MPIDRSLPTALQQAVLDFIESQIAATGSPPTYAEIRDHVSAKSIASVRARVYGLVLKGFVESEHGLPRSLRLVE